jgi:hypothetical protein
MLCKRHNQALSPLDAVATAFFGFFTAEWSGDAIEVFLTRGYDLERWMLKTLCGLVASGNATPKAKRLPTWTPPPEWLEILFGSADVGAPAGLHSVLGSYRGPSASFHFISVFNSETGYPLALGFTIAGISFLFAMEELPPMSEQITTGADTRYRPMALQLRKGERVREAHFGWPEGRLITVDVNG